MQYKCLLNVAHICTIHINVLVHMMNLVLSSNWKTSCQWKKQALNRLKFRIRLILLSECETLQRRMTGSVVFLFMGFRVLSSSSEIVLGLRMWATNLFHQQTGDVCNRFIWLSKLYTFVARQLAVKILQPLVSLAAVHLFLCQLVFLELQPFSPHTDLWDLIQPSSSRAV